MKGRKKVFLIMDGHPAHTAKAAKAYVEGLKGRLELHRLPTYAPVGHKGVDKGVGS